MAPPLAGLLWRRGTRARGTARCAGGSGAASVPGGQRQSHERSRCRGGGARGAAGALQQSRARRDSLDGCANRSVRRLRGAGGEGAQRGARCGESGAEPCRRAAERRAGFVRWPGRRGEAQGSGWGRGAQGGGGGVGSAGQLTRGGGRRWQRDVRRAGPCAAGTPRIGSGGGGGRGRAKPAGAGAGRGEAGVPAPPAAEVFVPRGLAGGGTKERQRCRRRCPWCWRRHRAPAAGRHSARPRSG
ncbi:PE-PGRS family protein PE_PGRS33-like [Melospiza melodia melodia]|uniref:PE-PGRS family protein PE_PGRS33-like n=1 Tax=Melospiza melodia melodia TaxID=1914991 RepID=UPI002FD082AE